MRLCFWCTQLAVWIIVVKLGYVHPFLALCFLVVSGFFIAIDWAKTYDAYWEAIEKKKKK